MSTSLSLDDAKDAKSEAESANLRESDAGIEERFDYEENEVANVRIHPETLVTFDRIVDYGVFNTPDDFLDQRQNVQNAPSGPNGENWGRDGYVVLENPTIVDGQLWAEDDDFTDYRIIGDVTDEYSPYEQDVSVGDDGDAVVEGVDMGMGGFDGEMADSPLDAEYIQVFVSARRAGPLLGQLDTAGMWSHAEDGSFVEGILETPPEFGTDDYDPETHGAPRAIGYPELREDMVGQRGAVLYSFQSDNPTQTTGIDIDFFTVEDGDLSALSPLTPEDDAYNLPEYPRGGRLYWEHDDDVDAQDMGEDVRPNTDDGVAEAKAMLEEDDTTNDSGMPYEGLSEDGRAFVDTAVEAINKKGFASITDFDDWDERYEKAKAADEINVEQDVIAEIIDSRL